jgi:predicted  nucleic acid-binding Zn-ribbon protein
VTGSVARDHGTIDATLRTFPLVRGISPINKFLPDSGILNPVSLETDLGSTVSVHAENIGGIDETTVSISRGITALIGQNATNRTSLLQAIAGALGSDHVTLKSDAEEGETSLVVGEETFTRRLRRKNGTVTRGGDPYPTDSELVDLYAVLLENNEVRRAVRQGRDLRDLIMRPVDTEAIRREIGALVDERQRIDEELDRLDALADELPDLEAERTRLESELSDAEERLEAKRAEREERKTDEGDRSPSERGDVLDERLASLRAARSDLESVEEDLRVEHKSLESFREDYEAAEEQYESLSVPDDERLSVIEERIEGLRERKRSLESTISELGRVVQFNKERLEESGPELLAGLSDGAAADEHATSRLVAEGTTTCWTCGSEVERDSIAETVEQLRELRQRKRSERAEVAERIADLGEEADELQKRHEERDRLSSRLEELAGELERREETVETLEERRTELETRIEELETTVEQLQEAQQDELLSLQQEVSELTFERDRLTERLADIEADIERIESELESREELQTRRDEISGELTDLRTRIDRIQTEAVEGFNTHMAAVLDRLEYDNIARVWIESTERTVSEGNHRVTEETFDLHVVRPSESGATYEDSVDHLSESEREVVGLVVALAGYLVHDVQEEVPFMLLDSLEMIDGDRLAKLVSYLNEYVLFLVVVLLPDHAEAFEGPDAPEHRRITEV